ncbi:MULTISPECIES: type 2 isopentenyl-diphosphate Delta-isomerase [Pseudomonas]|uniref:Isopentenyl-diphosphate delta-isomerase n=1 Tax=Pseudomonas lutea TaxID=243924 RepID=A0A9X8QIM4_9PSED|nr:MULTISPECIES: type 2 isopentenyl-diphosphate Delta-isomerase [Pseudomonas]SEQ14763.1 isopentenyl-diphosphate delta-isomerase [Pseudomonas lutea]
MVDWELASRKNDHLDIVLDPARALSSITTGFEQIQFQHCALPELHLNQIDLATTLLGKPLKAPVLISSMTGGPERAQTINRHLAEAAETLGLALAVGSQRIALQNGGDKGLTGQLRQLAPSIPLLANIGAAQLVAGYGVTEARRAVDMIQADALIIHLNPLQEAVQSGGDRNWQGVLAAIEHLVTHLGVPIVIKEVGAGISADVAQQLTEVGVAVIDIAGAGGTSWAAVEAERAHNDLDRQVAQAFINWGIPTAQAIAQVREQCPDIPLIASGGIRNGADAAKAIRLGADVVGQAAAVLHSATLSPEAVLNHFEVMIRQLKVACFCTGSANLAELRKARLLRPVSLAET